MALQKRPTSKPGTRPAGFVVGRAAFEKISAVEGIRPSKAFIFLALLADQAGHPLDLSHLEPERFLAAMIASFHGKEALLAAEVRGLMR